MPRTAKSAALHLLEGNPNNKTKKELFKRKKNEEKLAIESDKIIAPSWLDTGAKKIFETVVEVMKPTSVLTNADVDLIAIYSDTYYDYLSFKRRIKKMGVAVKGKVNPFVRQKQKAGELMNKYANQLGLTPAARASLAIHLAEDSEEGEEDFE